MVVARKEGELYRKIHMALLLDVYLQYILKRVSELL